MNGNIAHFHCENCGKNYVYTDEAITLASGKSWNHSLAPYCTEDSANNFYIVKEDGINAAFKIQTINPWPAFNVFKKLVNGSLNVANTTYRFLIDVKLGTNAQLPTSKLDIQYYFPTATGFANVIISDGVHLEALGNVNSQT